MYPPRHDDSFTVVVVRLSLCVPRSRDPHPRSRAQCVHAQRACPRRRVKSGRDRDCEDAELARLCPDMPQPVPTQRAQSPDVSDVGGFRGDRPRYVGRCVPRSIEHVAGCDGTSAHLLLRVTSQSASRTLPFSAPTRRAREVSRGPNRRPVPRAAPLIPQTDRVVMSSRAECDV